jgi:carboxypeptidase C (cathepsin A)
MKERKSSFLWRGAQMKKHFCRGLLAFFIIVVFAAAYQVPIKPGIAQETQKTKGETSAPSEPGIVSVGKPSTTQHAIEVNGRSLKYTATTGLMPLKDEAGKPKATIFFTAYVKDDPENKSQRPVTFAFNGGPGASSIFLHLGALGPKRAVLGDMKALPPPYQLVTNEYTWLDFTDLVFIDPVGTGYSRPAPGVDAKGFYGVKGDIESVGDFIRLYCTHYQRWLSPKFIVGESYGTTRAAGLSGYLQNKLGMSLNGIFLISEVMNFQTITFTAGNDLPYILYLPAYSEAAWYHRKLPPALQADVLKTRKEVEHFALNEYLLALAKGDGLSDAERDGIVKSLAEYTGLPATYIKNSNLRVSREGFTRELLRSENLRIGVLDSRITAMYRVEHFTEDPSVFVVTGPLVATWNDYVRNELKYETDAPYEILSMKVNASWNWDSGTGGLGYLNVAETLEQAMNENRHLKVFIASGYYDLATSYFATRYTVDHLKLDPPLRGNITLGYYDAGHQMYTHLPSLKRLTENAAVFFQKALAH